MLNLRAFLSLDGSGFEVGIDKAQKKAKTFSEQIDNHLKRAFSFGAILAGYNRISRMFDDLAERSKNIKLGTLETGLDIETSQRFLKTLEATNVSANTGANALEKLAAATEKLKSGEDSGGRLAASFALFGVTLEDIKKKDYRQIFFQISDAMKTMAVDAKSLGALENLLGGKAGDLVPAMKIGFNSRAANLGGLSENEIAQIDKLNKMTKEASSAWKNLGNEIAIAFQKWKIGMLSGPSVIAGIFSAPPPPIGTGYLEGKINEARQAKAQREQQRNQEAAKAQEAQKIREGFMARAAEFEAEAAAEKFSLLTSEQKLHVLKAQAQVLRDMREGLEGSVRNDGDPTGERGAKIAELKLMQLRNTRQQAGLRDDPLSANAGLPAQNSINSLQQIGARVSGSSMQGAVQSLTQQLRNNTTAVQENTRVMQNPSDMTGVRY